MQDREEDIDGDDYDDDVFPMLLTFNQRERVSLAGGRTDETLRSKLLDKLFANRENLRAYRVPKRMPGVDGLYLQLAAGYILLRQIGSSQVKQW